jgi:phage replication-related protein YjqB (UPF0714/DUF867 family)
MPDKYPSFAELAKSEKLGKDYEVVVVPRPESSVAILAPHGGGIESGTSELAISIAAADHNLFIFSGRKSCGNGGLHIGSERFDHPDCVVMLSRSSIVLGVHGCRGEAQIYVGGLDDPLATLLTHHLCAAGLPATTECPRHLAGRQQRNICNGGMRGCGAQLEITIDLRAEGSRPLITSAVRAAIAEHATAIHARS